MPPVDHPGPRLVSTGALPEHDTVEARLRQTHKRLIDVSEGELSQVYPALSRARPEHFGLAVVEVDGTVHEAGDSLVGFTIMSVAKPFTFALVAQHHGIEKVRRLVGVNATGLPFNSAEAIDRGPSGRTNPMVNSGAIAVASAAAGTGLADRWETLRSGLSRFAGRELRLDDEVYDSAARTNHRNRGLGDLLRSHDAILGDADEAVEIYTRQSCLEVTAVDLAVMGATLGDGGVNPITGEQVVDAESARAALATMVVAGMYETSGDWLLDVGMPGKSGIAGGIVTVSPGKGGMGTFSPLLDPAGNSVRGGLAASMLARTVGLDLLASTPHPARPSG